MLVFNWNVSIRWTKSTSERRRIADRHDEAELIVGDILRRRRGRARPGARLRGTSSRMVEPGTFPNPTLDQMAQAINAESEAGNA